jgi:bifunctional polynucleotide phosphatase/kinase
MNIQWQQTDNYIIGKTKELNLTNKKIAAFDLDDTLVTTKSDKEFAENENDWQLYDIMPKLTKLSKDGYFLVIISNQLGISKGKTDANVWKKKLENIMNHIKLDFIILCALKDDIYRKPRTKLWDEFVKGDKTASVYCGDAGGLKKRKINGNEISKDFSDTDLKFALNLGIKFIHRDEFVWDVKNVKCQASYSVDFSTLKSNNYIFKPNQPEMIINVGLPASGKSSFTKKYILPHNYEYVNRDTLKTPKKCLAVAETALKNNKSVVIDNTNVTSEERKLYIDLAKKYNIQCRCLVFTTSKEVCIHNNHYRNFITDNDVAIIPQIVYNVMNKKYEEPELKEGFYEINKIDFSPEFSNEDEKRIYFMYYN